MYINGGQQKLWVEPETSPVRKMRSAHPLPLSIQYRLYQPRTNKANQGKAKQGKRCVCVGLTALFGFLSCLLIYLICVQSHIPAPFLPPCVFRMAP